MSNDKGFLSGSITILIGAVIAIMALARGSLQSWLLIGVFTLWGLWIVMILLLPYMHQARRQRQRHLRERQLHAESLNPQPLPIQGQEEPVSDELLLRYANHRILAYLHSIYSNAYFEWCEKHPAELIRRNGTGRIRLYGVKEFDHADVSFGKDATIKCDMLKIVPLADLEADNNIPPNKQPVDPQIWYETQGRSILESLVSDLNSRGHSTLVLRENGDICIKQDEEEITTEHLPNFPAKVYWPRLIEVLDSSGLAAEITPQGVKITW